MISVRHFLLTCAGAALFVPFAAAEAQSQVQAQTAPSDTALPEGESVKDKPVEEEARICRSVRADPSSRRKTKVCRTLEEWRKLNVPL
ncbi:MAG: hypothetical protein ACKO1N_12680 [Erythrobacter sp.]